MPAKKAKEVKAKGKAGAAPREEGILEKLSTNSMMNRWQKRWFVLGPDSLAYYADHDAAAAARRPEEGKFVSVNEITECTPVGELELVVHSRDRVFQLRAATGSSRDKWISVTLKAVESFRTSDFAGVLKEAEDETKLWKKSLSPAVWKGKEQAFAVDKVFKDTDEFKDVVELFGKTMSKDSVVRVVRIQSRQVLASFRKFRNELSSTIASEGTSTKVQTLRVWHGCGMPEHAVSICNGGFQAGTGKAGLNQYGKGCYFARDASLAAKYAAQVSEPVAALLAEHPARLVGTKCVFLTFLAAGDIADGSHDRPRPSRIPGLPSGRRFDTMSDRAEDPSVLVSTAEAQGYPAYIVCFTK